MARWGWMWTLAALGFAACKIATWFPRRVRGTPGRNAAYLLLWPGMDPETFLDPRQAPAPPRAGEWLFALAKTAFGAALVWLVAPRLDGPMLKGWAGLFGAVFILHFGTFHLASLFWRARGIQAVPIMKAPILSASLGELWGRRWNLGFHDVARAYVFDPLAPRVGATGAAMAVFLVSGLIHDLVISVPAGGGYGLPTAYFVLQGIGVLAERTRFGRALGFGRGLPGRLLTILFAIGPMYWLFHPPFVRNVFLPFLEVIA